jgi:hypothetical protein
MATERSLERLGQDRFDLLLLHNPDRIGYTSETVWDALEAVRAAGLTTRLGVAPGPANGFTLDLIACLERYGDVTVQRVDAAHRDPSIGPVGPQLALALEAGAVREAEVDDGIDLTARPLGGHLTGGAHPRRRPRSPPRGPDGEGLVGSGEGLVHRHRLPGHGPGLQLQGHAQGVDRRTNLVRERPADASFHK